VPSAKRSGSKSLTVQLHSATAPISARQKIANAIHIVMTFNFRFGAHYGLNSDIAACPKRAINGSLPVKKASEKKPPEGGLTVALRTISQRHFSGSSFVDGPVPTKYKTAPSSFVIPK
jgi:hypothetical protein